jgi:hypothetical protein
MKEKDLERDEKFVVEVKSKHSAIQDLQEALEDYFHNKYGEKAEISVTFDELAQSWVVATKKGKKRVSYVESIPKAVHELL